MAMIRPSPLTGAMVYRHQAVQPLRGFGNAKGPSCGYGFTARLYSSRAAADPLADDLLLVRA
jgi:hypothetical protein